jgi:hypothetical protein
VESEVLEDATDEWMILLHARRIVVLWNYSHTTCSIDAGSVGARNLNDAAAGSGSALYTIG